MKIIKFSRSQILRTIRAACIALFFAACAQQAEAQPYYNHADFSVSGSNVTAIASDSTSAYFVDATPNAYAFTIGSAFTLGNTLNAGAANGADNDLISFDHGSVNNAGSLTATHNAIIINSTSSAVYSSVTNSGSLTSLGFTALDFRGNGTVNNVSGGTISGVDDGIYISGAGGASSVTNAGSITGTTTSDYSTGVGLGGGLHTNPVFGTSSFYVTNNAGGTISGSATYSTGTDSTSAYGVNSGSWTGNIGITNAATASITGTATSSTGSAYGYGISASTYGGNINIVNNGTATGTGTTSAYYQVGMGYGIYASSNYGNITVINTGTATGTGTGLGSDTNSESNYSGSGYGILANSDDGNVTVTNSGTASGTGSTQSSTYTGLGVGIGAYTYYGNVTVINTGMAKGTGSSTYSGYAEGYGISASSQYGNIVVSNGGPNAVATGTATSSGNYSATAYGISASATGDGTDGNITVTNNGTASGTATATFTQEGGTSANAYGYGISTSSNYGYYYGTTTILNNGTAIGSGSGYYVGNGFGISAKSYSGYIYITNNGTATGIGTASDSGGTPTASGYGIYASTYSGYISIQNNGTATGTGTATVGGDSASGYGYGIAAFSNYGYIYIQNCGTAVGTGSGYYLGSGSGIYARSNSGYIGIVNNGYAIGVGSSSAYGDNNNLLAIQGAGDPAYGYGIYAQSDGYITINNLCDATGYATSGIEEDGTITSYSDAPAYGSGIYARSSGSGYIFINNSGTASGYGLVWGSGSAYGYGIDITTTDSAYVTINNSGHVYGTGSSYAGTGSGYGIYIGSPSDGPVNSGPISITNQISGIIAGAGFTAYGSTSAYGIYLQNGTGGATITNKGVIAGIYTGSGYYGVGIYAHGYTGPITVNEIGGAVTTGAFSTTGSGYYVPMTTAIGLGSGINTVNMVGQVNNTGLVDGGSGGSNTLTMQLAGMTPAQKANLIAAVAATQGGGYSGPVFAGGVTYAWFDFNSVSGSFVSLEQAVDPGLMNIATKIDNLPSYLGVAYGPLYVDAASNPEAALNSLVGREFDDALGTISKNDATALSEVFDSRAFDLRSGTGGFDLSGLNIMSSSMIASLGQTQNMLDRLMGNSAMGGTTMSDSKEVITPVANTNRWGAWASGTVTLADESSSASGQSFNYTTGSPSIGADYRVCNDLAIGALLNFSTTGANFDDGSRLGVQTGLAALYATWSDGPWYVNALGGGGISSYDNHRVTLTGDTASSSPDGDEFLGNLTGGYDFKLGGGWKVSPEGGFLYTHVTENGYTESGASAFDLTLPDQNIDSLRSKLGFRILDNFTWDGIAFTPQFRASWYHEILDDSRGVTTSLGGAPALGSFTVQTNDEGRDFADLGAGLSATPAELSGDVTFFVNYDAQVGQDNFVAHTVNGGLRVNF